VSLVAITQRVDFIEGYHETRDALDQRLSQHVASVDVLPVPVPNILGEAILPWLERLRPAAIVLSGGNDIGECPDRDRTEWLLLNYAQDHGIPTLGICRGMQMMASWAGTGLKPVSGHVRGNHEVHGDINGMVNSFHTAALTGCPSGFEVTARSLDGEIEAIRHSVLPWEGWMWHPERSPSSDGRDLIRLASILNSGVRSINLWGQV